MAESPKTTSSDHDAMAPHWRMVDAILRGVEALRAGGEPYLPRFPKESAVDYDWRRKTSPLTNIYADISRNLASKPFSKPVRLDENSPEVLQGTLDEAASVRSGGLVDDIDGQGNNLHVFASRWFKAGIDKAIAWVLVDYPDAPPPEGRTRTQQEERDLGLRPYWVLLSPERVLAAYSDVVGGVEVFTHVRIHEPVTVLEGFKEVVRDRVRVLNRDPLSIDATGRVTAYAPATWTLYEEQKAAGTGATSWQEIGTGAYSIGVIPIVPFIPGERHGTSFVVDPPLRDVAHMQVEEFQQESNLKAVKALAAFPMLVGEGVPATDVNGAAIIVPVGPRAVLFAPPNGDGEHGTWKFIEPAATSLAFLKDDLAAFRQEMRDLGMQPLMAANLTVITTANVSRKASSQVQAWTILFKDAVDRALSLTCRWLGIPDEAEAHIFDDFAVEAESTEMLGELLKAEKQSIFSKRTVRDEFRRRGVECDEEQEEERIAEEQQGLEPEEPIDPVTGAPLGNAGDPSPDDV